MGGRKAVSTGRKENKDGNKTETVHNVDNLKVSVHNTASSELHSKPSTNVTGTPTKAARSANPRLTNFIWHGIGGGV
jgi:hypothetical protein